MDMGKIQLLYKVNLNVNLSQVGSLQFECKFIFNCNLSEVNFNCSRGPKILFYVNEIVIYFQDFVYGIKENLFCNVLP